MGDQNPAESAALLGAGGLNLGFGGKGPLQKGLAGEALGSAAGAFWSAVTGAGQTIATLSGEASFASTGITAANCADGVEAKVQIDRERLECKLLLVTEWLRVMAAVYACMAAAAALGFHQ